MGASNTPLYDMIELSGIGSNTTYTTAPGGGGDILGFVDTATYTDDESGNTASIIEEINETTDADTGRLFIDGVEYAIQIITPDRTSDTVTVTYNDGASSVGLTGNQLRSEVAFLVASPLGGGADRYFMVVDDSIGALADITSITTQDLDFDPAGDDVKIDLNQNNNVTVCFAAGTLIETAKGAVAVEGIEAGDLVETLDHGLRPVQWAERQELPLDNSMRARKNAPVRIHRGALGPGMPMRDLLLSPQHRVMLSSKVAQRMFGSHDILVPAKKLLGYPGVTRERRLDHVTYCHLYFGSHEVIWAEGAPAESLLPEKAALANMSAQARLRLMNLAPVPPARPIVEKQADLNELIRRHRKNLKPLVAPTMRAPLVQTASQTAKARSATRP